MTELLSAVILYVFVFGIDYLFYVKQKEYYNYTSVRTYLLFMLGQITVLWLFYDLLKPFLTNWPVELATISFFAGLLLLFTYTLTHDRIYVCSMSSRTLRCLTPLYVVVKGSEIVFQEMMYLVIALLLASLLGSGFLTYVAFVLVLLTMHVVVILGGQQKVIKSLTFGLLAISVPIFYIFTHLGVFWPAVYLHGIMYVFYWLTFANFDVPATPLGTAIEDVSKGG